MAWALHRLADAGLAEAPVDLVELAETLHPGFLAAPELTDLQTGTPPPAPSLLFGEAGVLLAAEAILGPDPGRRAALLGCVTRNARNPTRELCWGSPGTLLAAAAMWRATGDVRWETAWRDGARWLVDQWVELVWRQEMYGETRRYVGAGHGFAGVAMALLSAPDLLDAPGVVTRIADTAAALAVRDGELAQWPGLADVEIERRPVQWCHGAPGIVSSLISLPADPATDALLCAGGELTWRAGPLRKGVGLCHGTAGNAFALLALWQRTGDARWLDRARTFAADAAADVVARRQRNGGRGRYTLYTGDLGVGLALAARLGSGDGGLPFPGGALSPPPRARADPPASA